MRYKQVKIIPDDVQMYIDHLNTLDIPEAQLDFFIRSLHYEIGRVDDCDDFYIDGDYCFNLYGYTQKQTLEDRIKMNSKGFRTPEINYFNYDMNWSNGTHYIKLKNKPMYQTYYDKLQLAFPGWFEQDGKFVVTRKLDGFTTPDESVFDPVFVEGLCRFIVEKFEINGLWLNNFNNYAIQYNGNDYFHYDPDMYFVVEDTPEIKHITEPQDFINCYIYYKLRKKDIIYRVKDPRNLNADVLKYMYYSYHLLENMCHKFREIYDYRSPIL